MIAKRNTSRLFPTDFCGVFWLVPDQEGEIAKRNAWPVKIVALSDTCPPRV